MHPIALPYLSRQRGFTLLELLIASIIFALMAIMAYGGLANVMDNSKASQEALLRLKKLQQTVSILNRDFSQLVPRSIRDEFGNQQAPLTTSNIDYLVEFTRGGRFSPDIMQRSSLVRVAYQFEESSLIRRQWPQLDRGPNIKPKKSILLDNVENVTINFLQGTQSQEIWPPLNTNTAVAGAANVSTPPPSAIEVILKLKDWGDIRRIYQTN